LDRKIIQANKSGLENICFLKCSKHIHIVWPGAQKQITIIDTTRCTFTSPVGKYSVIR
jgi:hypothetical protein